MGYFGHKPFITHQRRQQSKSTSQICDTRAHLLTLGLRISPPISTAPRRTNTLSYQHFHSIPRTMSASAYQARLRPRHVHYEPVLPSFSLILADIYPMLEPVLFPTTHFEDDVCSRPPEPPIRFSRVEGDDEVGDVFIVSY